MDADERKALRKRAQAPVPEDRCECGHHRHNHDDGGCGIQACSFQCCEFTLRDNAEVPLATAITLLDALEAAERGWEEARSREEAMTVVGRELQAHIRVLTGDLAERTRERDELAAKLRDANARLAETIGDGGTSLVVVCPDCRRQHPTWSSSSTARCPKCARAQVQAERDELAAEVAAYQGRPEGALPGWVPGHFHGDWTRPLPGFPSRALLVPGGYPYWRIYEDGCVIASGEASSPRAAMRAAEAAARAKELL